MVELNQNVLEGLANQLTERANRVHPENALDTTKAAQGLALSEKLALPLSTATATSDQMIKAGKSYDMGKRLDSIKASHNIGQRQVDKSLIGYDLLIGRGNPNVLMGQLNRLDYEISREQRNVIDDAWYQKALNNAAGILPSMVQPLSEGVPVGLQAGTVAGITAGIAGQLGPQALVPEEVVTMPVAFGTGFVAGTVSGSARATYEMEAGAAYLELLSLRDENGNRVNPNIARSVAHSVGAVNMLVESIGLSTLTKLLPGTRQIIQKGIRQGMTDLMRQGAFKRLALNYAKQYPGMIAVETGQELVQESVSMLGVEIAKNLSDADIPVATIEEVLSRLEETASKTASGMAVLGLPGPGMNTMIDSRSIAVAKRNENLAKVLPPDKSPRPEEELVGTYERLKGVFFRQRDPRLLENRAENVRLKNRLEAVTTPRTVRGKVKEKVTKRDIAMTDAAIHVYIDMQNKPKAYDKAYKETLENPDGPNSLTPQQMQIIDAARDLTPEQIDFANEVREVYRDLADEAMDDDVIRNTIDNYTARAWKFDRKERQQVIDGFYKSTTHARHRVFDTLVEGWQFGKELRVEGAIDNLSLYRDQLIRAIETKRFFNSMKEAKISVTDTYKSGKKKGQEKIRAIRLLSTKKQPGFAKVDLANFTHYTPVEALQVPGKKILKTSDGAQLFETSLYAPAKVAKELSKIFGRSKIRDVRGVETLSKLNSMLKKTVLSLSAFHAFAYMRSYYLGAPLGINFSNMNVVSAYKQGITMVKNLDPIIIRGVANGLTLDMQQDWANQYDSNRTKLGDLARKVKPVGWVMDNIIALNDLWLGFLFSSFGMGLKAKTFALEYGKQLAKYGAVEDHDQIAERVAKLVNNDFGGLHLERIGRDPTLQHFFQLFALAPDWTESNFRTVHKLFKRTGNNPQAVRQMYRHFWARIVMKGVLATAMLNVGLSLLAGDDEIGDRFDDAEDFYDEMRKGWYRMLRDVGKGNISKGYKNLKKSIAGAGGLLHMATSVDITPIYQYFGGDRKTRKHFSVFGHFADPVKWAAHPIRTAKHKASIMGRATFEALTGEDWRGRRFTTLPELMEGEGLTTYARLPYDEYNIPIVDSMFVSYVISQLISATPVGSQNLISAASGETEYFDSVARSVGIQVSTKHD